MAEFNRTSRTIGSWLRNKASTELNKVNNPLVRSGLGSIVNAIDPRILGGGQFGDANVFRGEFDQRAAELMAELDQAASPSKAITTGSDNLNVNYDWRARLRPKNGGQERFYSAANQVQGGFEDSLMRPIQESNGLVFMNTPSVFLASSADYASHQGQGMQYPVNTYQSSRTAEITVNSEFTANDIYEARYFLAMKSFLQTSVKGYFGNQALSDGTAGSPPPVLLFEYLGEHGFNKVPVVVVQYSISFPPGVDYVPVELDHGNEGTVTYVPTQSDVSVTLMPQYTPRKLRNNFDVQGIANGKNYTDGFI